MDKYYLQLLILAKDNPDAIIDILQMALNLMKKNPKLLSDLIGEYIKSNTGTAAPTPAKIKSKK